MQKSLEDFFAMLNLGKSGAGSEPAEVKHLSKRRKRDKIAFP